MNKVKELLAKLKKSVLAAYNDLLVFLGVKVLEEQHEEEQDLTYCYSISCSTEKLACSEVNDNSPVEVTLPKAKAKTKAKPKKKQAKKKKSKK